MEKLLRIESDFSDYYDSIIGNGNILYKRFRTSGASRVKALKMLRANGFNTIDITTASNISREFKRVVVYTNPNGHGGKGKTIYNLDTALSSYSNYLCSPYIEDTKEYSMKFVQIGTRRFRVMMYNPNLSKPFEHGIVTDIEELPSDFNYLIKLPIFSIDYIPFKDIMIVTDFNEVQNLERLGFDKLLSPKEVALEIYKAFNQNR